MDINLYRNRYSKESYTTTQLNKVLEIIRTQSVDVPKEKRTGVVYATTTHKGRLHEDIANYTGMAFIDIDDCINPKEVKDFFVSINNTKAVWYSSRGNIHALIKIPLCKTKEEFKLRYEKLADDIKAEIGELGTFDKSASNPTAIAWLSSDSEIFINDNPETYHAIYEAKPKPVFKKPILKPHNEASTNWCINKARDWFNGITSNGYPQVVSFSRTLGGYSGGGYIGTDIAIQTIKALIESNSYLNSNDSSGTLKTYLKSAISSFNKGVDEPLEWN
jgi:hypothetical protein